MLLLSLAFCLSLVALITGKAITIENICQGSKVVTSTRFIGADKNVKLEQITCAMLNASEVAEKGTFLQARQASNVCGAPCTTHCFPPAGGGPDPNDCHIIADALRFDSQNVAPEFTVANGANNVFSLTFASCTSFFLNQATTSLNYCRTDFASLIDFIAPNCQATQNAHGGLCVANDGRWFVQVEPMVTVIPTTIATTSPTSNPLPPDQPTSITTSPTSNPLPPDQPTSITTSPTSNPLPPDQPTGVTTSPSSPLPPLLPTSVTTSPSSPLPPLLQTSMLH